MTREEVCQKLLGTLGLDPDIDSVDTFGVGSKIVGLTTDWQDGTQIDIILLNVTSPATTQATAL